MKIIPIFGISFFLVFVCGCASSHRSPKNAEAVYSEPGIQADQTSISRQASAEDVKVGEEIRQTLLNDKKLAPPPSNVIATVQDGVVTLRGTVPSRDDKQEMCARIMQLPGVARVDDELEIRRHRYSGW